MQIKDIDDRKTIRYRGEMIKVDPGIYDRFVDMAKKRGLSNRAYIDHLLYMDRERNIDTEITEHMRRLHDLLSIVLEAHFTDACEFFRAILVQSRLLTPGERELFGPKLAKTLKKLQLEVHDETKLRGEYGFLWDQKSTENE